MKKNFVLPVLILLIGISGCNLSPVASWDGDLNDGEIESRSDLFVEDSEDSSTIVFFTNDSEDSGPYGTTFWSEVEDSSQDPYESWSLKVTKNCGKENAGYGVFFCRGDHGGDADSMLTVLIRTDGYYQVAEVIGTDYTVINEWTYSSNIKEGKGSTNLISIKMEDQFILSFNNSETYEFEDAESPINNSGTQGYLVVLAPNETSSGSVKVTFEEVE